MRVIVRKNGRKYTHKELSRKPEGIVDAVGDAYRSGTPILAIAKRFGVSRGAIYRWIKAYQWEVRN